jgi:hypothetical protein
MGMVEIIVDFVKHGGNPRATHLCLIIVKVRTDMQQNIVPQHRRVSSVDGTPQQRNSVTSQHHSVPSVVGLSASHQRNVALSRCTTWVQVWTGGRNKVAFRLGSVSFE